ncbi:MAG: hypothetical protein P9F75_08805 [Candidatus Contendobacter sp.]|nr:hypothetical protein [Candidatus Contendobacter sp.]
MTSNTLPADYAFAPALSHQEVESICSTTSHNAVMTRALMAVLTRTSGELMDAWSSETAAFLDLFEKAPATIECAKAMTELLQTAYNRLMLTGHVTFNGVDEAVSDPQND